MPLPPPAWLALPGWLPFLIPLILAAAAALPAGVANDPVTAVTRRARLATAVSLALACATCLVLVLDGEQSVRLATLLPLGAAGDLQLSVRLDTLTCLMLMLVCLVGSVIVRFARGCLDGEPQLVRHLRWLLATLSAVALAVVANNLLLICIAWIATSLALHRLLLHYPERPQARLAAHKKFVVSRIADACLLGAAALVGMTVGSLELDVIFERVTDLAGLPPALRLAASLFAAGAILKCAQLPFHGWLIQVVEAPTPVSALLHAGVVNLGGFLMIRLAPLMAQVEFAQTLLVTVGTATAVVASLVMTTRVSVKTALAWSTCAQMGFMLLQCGLGAYTLALLHLVGHSFYKAHAFLSSGSTVEQWRTMSMRPVTPPAGTLAWLLTGAVTVAAVAAGGKVLGLGTTGTPGLAVFAAIAGLAVSPLLLHGATNGARRLATASIVGIAVLAAYAAGHHLFATLLGPTVGANLPAEPRLAIVGTGFGILFLLQAVSQGRPDGRLAARLQPLVSAGFYLDELFSALALRLWPHRGRDRTRSFVARCDRQEA